MGVNNNGSGQTKADVIITKVDGISQQNIALDAKVERVIASSLDREMDREAIIQKLSADNQALLQEIEFLSAQIQSIYKGINKNITQAVNSGSGAVATDVDELSSKVAEKIIVPQNDIDYGALADEVAARITVAVPEIDIDALAEQVAAKIVLPEVPEIDLDALAERVSEKIAVPEQTNAADAIVGAIDTDALAEQVAAKLNIDADELGLKVAENIYVPTALVEDVDYETLASKVAAYIPAPEVVSPDYVASKVAEQLVNPTFNIDEESLVSKIVERISALPVNPVEVTVDEDRIAYSVVEKIRAEYPPVCETVSEEVVEQPAEAIYSEEVVEQPAAVYAPVPDAETIAAMVAERIPVPVAEVPEIDLDALAEKIAAKLDVTVDDREIADCVAKKVGTIAPEQFEIMVDEDGCDTLAKAVESKLDYEAISAAVAEKLGGQLSGGVDIDTDELARQLGEKINVGVQINEDALADKAAAVLSNFMPEVDTDEIAEKVVSGVVPSLPQVEVDGEGIAASVAEKIAEKQEDQDFDIVIDEEGLEKITLSVSEKIKGEYDERFNKVDEDIAQIRQLAEARGEYDERFNKVDEDVAQIMQIAEVRGEYDERFNKVDEDVAQIRQLAEVKGEYDERFNKIDEEIREIKAMLAAGVIAVAASDEIAPAEAVAEEELVTVSDIVDGQTDTDDEDQDGVIDEIVEGIDETPSDGEIMPDGIPGISNSGVDFSNMMKYNRSFIARIIQGSDEQKQYYGQVKNALLSYKKVNSNIAWGAERFNKGRETIARFKIRGKTLCLYLALDPKEYPESVYHQVDVSDNKSMSGTPMMVKIKSPRGVKKAIRLIDEMLEKRQGVKQHIVERDYAAMYPYESIEELIEDGLVKDVSKK